MEERSIAEIRKQAEEMHAKGRKWHFHMLTPSCRLNSKERFAFVLEGEEALVSYSDAVEKETGKHLVVMLDRHVPKNSLAQELVEKARELHAKGAWHHHKLFPDCMFNKRQGAWCVILEGDAEIVERFFDEEPDISEIEQLFYSRT